LILACGSSITGAIDSFFADLTMIAIFCLSRLVRHYVPLFLLQGIFGATLDAFSLGASFGVSPRIAWSAPGLFFARRPELYMCSLCLYMVSNEFLGKLFLCGSIRFFVFVLSCRWRSREEDGWS
jgi:hypothetical protein